jgi:cysteine-rich repeat protein
MSLKSLWVVALLAGCGFGDNNGSAVSAVDGGVDGQLQPADDARVEIDAQPGQPVCGNGTREGTEECDDGNFASGDGCAPNCMTETAAACSLVPQSGCSGATPACDIGGLDVTECRGVTSMGTSNNHCSADTECKAGYTCITDDGAANAVPWCARFCLADGDCTGTGSRCIIGLLDENDDPLNVKVCSNACNPDEQTGCPSGMGCIALGAPGGDFTDCRYMGNTLDGDSCDTSTDCREGSTCVTYGTIKSCQSYCVVGDDSTCPQLLECSGFSTPLMIGNTEYGICD